ncbi:receptor-like protein 4 [Diospyros lotus]|uniref:receptor-like protein 4 n=1 Tax=Diospyros lotus TaxID=55363 RepID=UPI00224E5D8C|nr:receptor-like protein 4 [Diospyros lotus]
MLLLFLLFAFFSSLFPASSRPAPYAMRMSCGALNDVHTLPTNALWHKDIGYTGGIRANATRPSFITPPLKTLRYFPLSEGPENCYNITGVPKGRYSVRIFFGLVANPDFDNEPLFDVSVEGTQIYSLKSGWSNNDNEKAFVEALIFLTDGSASLCFHSTGHGDPAILSIEILQVDDRAYGFGTKWGQGTILRTERRLSCGTKNPKFDEDYSGDHWGGDRFWNPVLDFGQHSDRAISTPNSIKQATNSPNFYPESLYQTALISTDRALELTYTIDVDPNRNYSIWLHFAEIDTSVTGAGERVFDILINGDIVFQDVDIVNMSGDLFTALVLNRTIAVNGRTLTITMQPVKGHAIINAIEIFEVIMAESKTMPHEVRALQIMKSALGLPLRFGWNGDPCVPQQHPWSGVYCQFNRTSSKWVIDGLGLDNQGLKGFFPNEISNLSHLQSINFSGNSIQGPIPSSLGTITTLEILDLSYNSFNGSIPQSLGQLTSLKTLNLNGNSLFGRVPAALGGRLLHRASFNFTDNTGLCGIPGLPTCGPHLSIGAKIGIVFASCVTLLLISTFLMCWWKRRQNTLRAQRLAARDAPYAKARTHFSRDVQLIRHHGHNDRTRTASENGPILLS